MLYFRFIILLVISLFTSRIVLKTLGFSDFGLYNVVGGFVSLLSFLNNYASQATSRFLTYELGNGNAEKLKDTFSGALFLHICIAIVILLAGETIGLWYVENKLNIEEERRAMAVFVYELSLITACMGFIQTPFNASVTSHEDMKVYAYISIFDVVAKLLIVYLLLAVDKDKLQVYSVFLFCVSLLTSLFYVAYCMRKYPECGFRLKCNKGLYKKMFNYIGWNSIGSVAFAMNNQGITILLNSFFGTVVNAARGVAGSLSNIVGQFVFNFQTAMRPQIIKTYANGEIKEMEKMILYCSRYSSYLCMIFGIPLFIEADTILRLWLGDVPPYAATFVRITMMQIMIQAIDFPVGYGINAVGKMKLPNITSSLVYLLVVPISYIAMKMGANPVIAYVVSAICFPLALLFDVWILQVYIGFDVKKFYSTVVAKLLLFVVSSSIIPMTFHIMMSSDFQRLSVVTIMSLLCSFFIIYYKGIDCKYRTFVLKKIKSTFLFRKEI